MIPVLISTGSFDALLEACDRLRQRYDFVGQIGKSAYEPGFRCRRLVSHGELDELVRSAEMVITHGGTGMLSLVHLHRKPCVIVPRQRRYGHPSDEQVPLSRKWSELGMGILCLDVDHLERSLLECRSRQFVFPTFPALGDTIRALIVDG